MNLDALFLDYEQVLIGNRDAISQFNFFGAAPGGSNQSRALDCIRYILEDILEWDIEESKKKFDTYIVKLMKMERLMDYIEYPDEIKNGDTYYVLSLLYPNDIKLNQKTMIEDVYKKVLNGEGQFPREYFLGQKGFYRFSICLCYLITNYKPFATIEELYAFFSTAAGRSFMDDYRLRVPAEHLNIDVLKCIYTITEEEVNSYLYYCLYSFLQQYQKILQEETAAS